ncbi:hypothetical protein F5B20DRAFT_578303 [Whalleya microplaca]|nr:hypothetical protein F5B20DRAFT_578303 [Whalleya microplaca]
MDSSAKRKQTATDGPNGRQFKRSKGGSGGKWQTPHHKTKLEALRGKSLEVGDMGIWTTCVKGKERQALQEMVSICDEYAEKLYGIKPQAPAEAEDDEDDDIESSIKKEVEGMKPADKPKESIFEPMRMDLDCLLFIRTRSPVDPVEMVHHICRDAKAISDRTQRRSRFINRFTPIEVTGRATENGVEEVAKAVLRKHFQLAGDEDVKAEGEEAKREPYSYAIRLSFRAHNILKRDDVIKNVASLIAPSHKVNLTAPGKVILIDIFRTFCGMSVVDGDWDALKRYNLHELYLSAAKSTDGAAEASKEESKEESKEGPKEEVKKEPKGEPKE